MDEHTRDELVVHSNAHAGWKHAVQQLLRRSVPVVTAPDGRTERVCHLEARGAETALLLGTPTEKVQNQTLKQAEEFALDGLKTEKLAHELKTAGDRRRAKKSARAESADADRSLEADVNVRASALSRCRKRWTLIGWTVLLLALAFMCVNVQAFAAAGADKWSAQWIVAWGVDPLLSMLVVGLLLSRGDLAAFGFPMSKVTGRSKLVILGVEIAVLLAELGMNVAPELAPGKTVNPALVVLHVVVPMAAVAAAVVLPIVQGYYASAITALDAERNQFDSSPAAVVAPKPQRRSPKKTTEPTKTVMARAEDEPARESSVVESNPSKDAQVIDLYDDERPGWVTTDMNAKDAVYAYLDRHGVTNGARLTRWVRGCGFDVNDDYGRNMQNRWKRDRSSDPIAVGEE